MDSTTGARAPNSPPADLVRLFRAVSEATTEAEYERATAAIPLLVDWPDFATFKQAQAAEDEAEQDPAWQRERQIKWTDAWADVQRAFRARDDIRRRTYARHGVAHLVAHPELTRGPAGGTSRQATPTRKPHGRAARLSTSTRRRGSRRTSSTSTPRSSDDDSGSPGSSKLPAAVRERVQAILDAEARRLLAVEPADARRAAC